MHYTQGLQESVDGVDCLFENLHMNKSMCPSGLCQYSKALQIFTVFSPFSSIPNMTVQEAEVNIDENERDLELVIAQTNVFTLIIYRVAVW